MGADTQTPALPTAAAFAAVRAAMEQVRRVHATIGAGHHLAGNCADCLVVRAPCESRMVADTAEAGLRLAEAVAELAYGDGPEAGWPPLVEIVAEFDAAVRAACGEAM